MYSSLKTRPIKHSVKKHHKLKDKVKHTLQDCFKFNAFSTFPYLKDSYTSKQAIKKTNSGNCIALSMFIKQQLKDNFNIDSYLIPATVPSYIHKEGYLDICHVALMIPVNKNSVYLVDPAFYVMDPIEIKMKGGEAKPVRSMNIYENKVDTVNPSLQQCGERLALNEYQSLPKGTRYCQCYYNQDSHDTWNYYLREIMNPDQAVSQFFTAIRNEPFFVSTKVEDGLCKKDIIIRTYNGGDHVSIKLNDSTMYDGHLSNIPQSVKQQMSDLLMNRGYDNRILNL